MNDYIRKSLEFLVVQKDLMVWRAFSRPFFNLLQGTGEYLPNKGVTQVALYWVEARMSLVHEKTYLKVEYLMLPTLAKEELKIARPLSRVPHHIITCQLLRVTEVLRLWLVGRVGTPAHHPLLGGSHVLPQDNPAPHTLMAHIMMTPI